jgi:hypothetical protein
MATLNVVQTGEQILAAIEINEVVKHVVLSKRERLRFVNVTSLQVFVQEDMVTFKVVYGKGTSSLFVKSFSEKLVLLPVKVLETVECELWQRKGAVKRVTLPNPWK